MMFRKSTVLSLLLMLSTFSARGHSPCYDWTGFYIGVYGGGGWGSRVHIGERFPFNPGTGSWENNLASSWIGGGTLGYNYHISKCLFGIENEIGYLNLKGCSADPHSPFPGSTLASTQIGSWYDVLALRLGYNYECILVYTKIGFGVTRLRLAIDDDSFPPFNTHSRGENWPKFLSAGAGFEYGFCGPWSLKAEYLFLNIHHSVNSRFEREGSSAGRWHHDFHGVHTWKLGINYRFAVCK